MKNYFNKFLIISLLLIISCSQNQPAQVDYYGNYNKKKQQLKINDQANYHIVKNGDTLMSIAKQYNINYKDLVKSNNLNDKSIIKVGNRLIIPSNKYHIVQNGETLSKIAQKYNIDINNLAAINNINPPYKVRLGQRLVISKNRGTNQMIIREENNDQPAKNNNYNPYESVKIKKLEEPDKTNLPQNTETTAIETPKAEVPKTEIPQKKELNEEKPQDKSEKNKFIWPLKGTITSNFGITTNGTRNDGINIQAQLGNDVKSAGDGVVAYAGNGLKGYGNLVIIKHEDDILTAYAHLDDLLVQKGTKVTQSQVIGHVGNTGDISSPQLHFAVRKSKKPINPLSILPQS